MMNKKEVKHIAQLARLGMTPREEERFAKELSSVLKYVGKLKEVDVSKTEAVSHPFKVENVMRVDEATKDKKKLIEGFLQVKSVF
ncbi:MAG: Asp-tRNA(Asn)/Glu-tRNA(Gln) amidotransferase subunit GatC [Candidatus Nealsonbacteria bacterium]|nr:Asp-tRNA(Asn)/Glu-tRNA(Gln) amidotransferase subunit GatC [Candidatus Nealsonbacteria bacterium]